MKTECGHCQKVLPNPTAAAKHVAKMHEAIQMKPAKGQPVFNVTWNKTGVIRQPKGD